MTSTEPGTWEYPSRLRIWGPRFSAYSSGASLTAEEIRRAYPQVTPEGIRAALAYAAEALHFETLAPLS